MMYLTISILYSIVYIAKSAERIWIIRHCDKINQTDVCCSDRGYQRSAHWYRYFQIYQTPIDYIYAANFIGNISCTNPYVNDWLKIVHPLTNNKRCDISQREYITAMTIYKSMKLSNSVNSDFCFGEYPFLVHNSVKNPISDVLIVWNHIEIPNIIRQFNIPISDWPNTINQYDVVFMIDVEKLRLYYDCYNDMTGTTICSHVVEKWLSKYEKIEVYHTKLTHKLLGDVEIFDYILFIILSLICAVGSACPLIRRRNRQHEIQYSDITIIDTPHPDYQSFEIHI